MTFTVYVDAQRWRDHHRQVVADLPGLVPVAKGNGYGVGNSRLATAADELGADTLAVGLEQEVAEVAGGFGGDLLVLTPLLPGHVGGALPPADEEGRVVHTVAHVSTLAELPAHARVVVECRTSMRRHGVVASDLDAVAAGIGRARLEGLALHFPLDRPGGVDPVAETAAWLALLAASGLPTGTLWVSHLSSPELETLRAQHPGTTFRPRVGTRLWLGDPQALHARGTVLDVEPLRRGERSGYRQHRAPGAGHLVVVSGGTAHGVALEAPKAVRGPVARAKVLTLGTLEAVGRNLSPFRWAGRRRWFVEPPHMQVSLLFVPNDVEPPPIGAELDCAVRLTTTHPDRVVDR